MKPLQKPKFERQVRNLEFQTDAGRDEQVLERVLVAYRERRREDARRPQSMGDIIMHNRTVHIAAAAVIVVAALAIGVEVLRPAGTDGPSAFSAQLQANTALDLDPKAAIPLRQAQPGDFDVTWDAEDGGTLRIMSSSSLRLLAPPWPDAEWDDVVGWAHARLEKVLNSTATSVAARERRFAAILTSEGNLAIVQIGDYDEDKARLRWQVESTVQPGFGPVQEVTLTCVDPNNPSPQPCAIDFDTGQTSVIPSRALRLTPELFSGWLEENGIDAIAGMTDAGSGLSGVGLACEGISLGVWTVVPGQAARDIVGRIPYQSRDPILFQEGRYQIVYAFKTREGAVGILQMRGADRDRRTVQFRYKLVQPDTPAGAESQTQEDDESLQLLNSARWLCDLGKSVLLYASDHEDRLPESLEALREYAKSDEEYRWMIEDVEYLGKGVTTDDPYSLIVAYDKALLPKGKGTNVLFLDSHIEYAASERLAELGLPAGPQDALQ